MTIRLAITTAALVAAAALGCAQEAGDGKLRLDTAPKWYEIVGDGITSGSTCPVRSLATKEIIGVAEPLTRFLSFGADRNFVVFAYKGVMSYVPASAAQELYPTDTGPVQYRSGGKTLEQQAEEAKKRVEEVKTGKVSLAPNFTNQPTPKPTPGAMDGMMPGAAMGGREGAL